MFVELHMLQNFAPSCLNRDDTNSPKDCEFGGYRRARISSQCIKRSIRKSDVFEASVQTALGQRTKMLPGEIASRLVAAGKPEATAKTISEAMASAIWGELDDKGKNKALIFASNKEIEGATKAILNQWDELTGLIKEGEPEKARVKKGPKKSDAKDSPLLERCKSLAHDVVMGELSPDIALFGRMVAEKTNLNVAAACQVAHGISTNRVNMEMDFYTAVDDLRPKDEIGAGMMGTIEFDSACFYRFSTINLDELKKNLGGDTDLAVKTLEAFLRASILAIPSGRQNSMAAHNPPSMVMMVLRERGQPMSLTNAFVRPVAAEGGDMISESIARLDGYYSSAIQMYGKDGLKFIGVAMIGEQPTPGIASAGGVVYKSVDQLIGSLKGVVNGRPADAA